VTPTPSSPVRRRCAGNATPVGHGASDRLHLPADTMPQTLAETDIADIDRHERSSAPLAGGAFGLHLSREFASLFRSSIRVTAAPAQHRTVTRPGGMLRCARLLQTRLPMSFARIPRAPSRTTHQSPAGARSAGAKRNDVAVSLKITIKHFGIDPRNCCACAIPTTGPREPVKLPLQPQREAERPLGQSRRESAPLRVQACDVFAIDRATRLQALVRRLRRT
jgi:hypothetical protein